MKDVLTKSASELAAKDEQIKEAEKSSKKREKEIERLKRKIVFKRESELLGELKKQAEYIERQGRKINLETAQKVT